MQQPVAATPLLGQLPLAKYSTEIYSLGCPILVKSLNFVPLIRVSIRIDILGRFLHFQSFRATFTIPQLTCKFCYIYIIFALREDLICHFRFTYCVRYQGDRVLFTASCPSATKAIGFMGNIKWKVINYISICAQFIKYFANQLYFMRPFQRWFLYMAWFFY